MPRVVQKIQTIILFIFLFNCASIIGLKTNTRLRLKTTTTQLQPSSEKNDELAGTLFDSLGSPDESTSDKLNDDSKEIEGAPSTGNKDPFVNTEPDTVNTVNDDELKKAAEEAEKKKLEEEAEKKKLEEEAEKKRLEDEAEKKRLEDEALKAKAIEKEIANKKENETPKEEENKESDDNIKKIKVDSIGPLSKIHYPFIEEKSTKTRAWAIATLIVFGSIYLFLRLIYNYFKNLNKFYAKCTASLANQIMFLLICFIVTLLFYVYGTFDSIPINWEYLISGMALFILSWFVYGSFIILLSLLVIRRWKLLEKSANSFTDIRHKYDKLQNKNFEHANMNYSSPETKSLIESFEFLVLKRFFFIPLFPTFKASSLRKEMKFSVYLEKCLLEKIRLFFKFSWTCWVLTICVMMFWNVFIAPNTILCITIYAMVIPIIGLAINVILFLYLKSIYRKVVEHITQNNMSNYQDIEYNSKLALQSMGYPVYLMNLIQDDKEMEKLNTKSKGVHEHLHQRPASLYENLMLGGATGFAVMLNIIQTCSLIFVCWIIVLFTKHLTYIFDAYSKKALIFIIPIFILYFVLQGLSTAIVLKWHTLIDSIEMKRNEKCIKKMVNYHIKKAGRISEEIFQNFKRIYFDIKTNPKLNVSKSEKLFAVDENENELKLGFPHLQEIIRLNVARYTHSDKENAVIDIKEDLLPFIKSFGNSLNQEEIEYMLHFIENFEDFKGKITVSNLFDIYGAILHFRTQKPMNIFKCVFNHFYDENPQYYKDTHMTYKNIELFINAYNDFFTKEQTEFIKEQCNYLGESFSFESLITTLISFRQFYPY